MTTKRNKQMKSCLRKKRIPIEFYLLFFDGDFFFFPDTHMILVDYTTKDPLAFTYDQSQTLCAKLNTLLFYD